MEPTKYTLKENNTIKKLLSYLLPISHKIYHSDINGRLELTWTNGKLILDTENTNYSYGNLQVILHKSLGYIGFETVKK